MARKRMIDPEFWLDEDLAKLSPYARLLFIGTWGICDDNYATFPGKIGWLKHQIFPYEEVDVQGILNELSASTHLVPFEDKGEKYYFIRNFFKYQKVDHPSLPKFPKPPRGLTEGSLLINELNKLNKADQVIKNSREQLKERWSKKNL